MSYAAVGQYLQSRLSDPEFGGWLSGSVVVLTSAYLASPGRSLERRLPPPKMSRILVEPPLQRSDGLALPHYSVMEKFVFLWRIAFSSRRAKEYRTVLMLTVIIILRTIVSVRMVKNVGAFSTACINGNMRELMQAVGAFILSSLPAVGLNVSLSYYSQMLELYLRTNLSRYFHRRYLTPKVFFRLAGLHQVEHVDQRITEDVQRWASVTAALCTAITRPLCEAITFSAVLGRQAGMKALGMTWGYYLGFMALSFHLAPNVDWLASQRMEKEGAFRGAHQNLLSYAEEICLSTCSGLAFQRDLLNQRFQAVTDQSRYAAFVHAKFNLVEGLYNKYGSILLSYLVAGVAARNAPAGEMTSCFSSTSYTFKLLSQAISRLLWNIKLVLAANGYTQRLFQLVEGLELAQFEVDRQSDLTSRSPVGSIRNLDASLSMLLEQQSASSTFGRVIHGEHIEFMNVPLTTPSGEILCPSLSFHVQPGMNVLIMGPNGCGKSSTFRLLGELWPLRGGRMIKPEHDQLYYVPQRPYMYDGTLFEQVIYPLKRSEVEVGESELLEYMEMAHLQHVFDRPNVTWDSHLSWSDDTFSAGEKQRLAMARLFFHRPRFAILDECSSLLDEAVEADLYRTCRELGISLITIAHRRSVWAHHNWILYFDGNGGYMFSPFELEDQGTKLVLLRVESCNDDLILGERREVKVAPLWEDDLESTQVPV